MNENLERVDLLECENAQPEENKEEATASEATKTAIDRQQIEKLINHHVYASLGMGVIFLPVLNFASVTAIQLNMVRKLSDAYGLDFKENLAKKILTTVVSSAVPSLASKPLELLMMSIPIVGAPLSFATLPALNGLSTLALGKMFVNHFELGGNFVNANVDILKDDFKKAYQNSREQLGDMIGGKKAAEEGR